MADEKEIQRPACSTISTPKPEDIVCPKCKTVNEIWSDQNKVKCVNCGAVATR